MRRAIIAHYAASSRTLPWRTPPGSSERADPYRVWLSEVMLQQTTVAAVIPYFGRFTARWPDVAALAAADPADVLAAWAGLGYYSRARNLIACSRIVVQDHGGRFPHDEAGLRALPGIGEYSAAAISAIAFGGSAIVIDANVARVVARLFAIEQPLPAKAALRRAATSLWPATHGGDFAQALMDLGAGPCSARHPQCSDCPMPRWCRAFARGIAAKLPVKPPRRIRRERHGRALWIEDAHGDASCVWLVRRPWRGMLGGMRALPDMTGTAAGSVDEWGDAPIAARFGTDIGRVRHVFTHFALTMALTRVDDLSRAVGEGEWWPISRLDEAGLPTLYRRLASLMTKETP